MTGALAQKYGPVVLQPVIIALLVGKSYDTMRFARSILINNALMDVVDRHGLGVSLWHARRRSQSRVIGLVCSKILLCVLRKQQDSIHSREKSALCQLISKLQS